MIALATWGVRRWLYGRHHVSTDNAQVDGHITAIAPRIAGFIDRVPGRGEPAREGGRHARRARSARSHRPAGAGRGGPAERRGARWARGTGAGQAEAQLQATRAEAASAEADVTAAEATYRQADADYERYRGLAATKIVSAQQLDAAQAARDAAAANLEAARRRAAAAGSQVSASGAALRGADARLAAAQSAVETARLQLSYATLLAPDDGVVAKRSAEPGALVQIGPEPDVDRAGDQRLGHGQPEGDPAGQRAAWATRPSSAWTPIPASTFHGKVESLSPATGARFALLPPDNATGNFTKVVQRVPVRIAVDGTADPAHPLRPGMSVDVTITTD